MIGNNLYFPSYDPIVRNPGGPLYQRTRDSQVWEEGCQSRNTFLTNHTLTTKHIFERGDKLLPGPNNMEFQILKLLGEGSFGQAYSVMDTSSRLKYAMKSVQFVTDEDKRNVKREIDALRKIRRSQPKISYLLTYYESFFHGTEYCIFTEQLDMNLFQYLERRHFQPLPIKDVKDITHQILCGLCELHGIGLVHSDLKPWNIMFADMHRPGFRVKLIDVGNINEVYEMRHRQAQILQSLPYRAPEVILGLPVDEKIDQWSAGITIIELYTGRRFFQGHSEDSMINAIGQVFGLPENSCDGVFFESFAYYDMYLHSPMLKVLELTRQKHPECWYDETGMRQLHMFGDNMRTNGIISQDDILFERFLERILHINAAARPTSHKLLDDPFVEERTALKRATTW